MRRCKYIDLEDKPSLNQFKACEYLETFDINLFHKNKRFNFQRERKDTYIYTSTSATYTGEWKGTFRDGYGIQVWQNGASYEGQWVNNMAHGKGKFLYVNGDVYKGNMKYDRADGYGKYTFKDGNVY